MFNFLKKLFASETPVTQLDETAFPAWFEQKVAASGFAMFIPEYFRLLAQLKLQLLEKAEILRQKEISEQDKKGVQHRVKTIVLSSKQHYLQAVENFAQKINLPSKEKYVSLKDLEEARQFNEQINQQLDEFSHFSVKSYHAAKHLFYEEVDEIAQVLKQLNNLVKEFEKKAVSYSAMQKIEETFSLFLQEKSKQENLTKEKQAKEEKLKELKNRKNDDSKKIQSLMQSEEHQNYLTLKKQEQELIIRNKEIDSKVHEFLFKLNKPLKKYQYSKLRKIDDINERSLLLDNCVQISCNPRSYLYSAMDKLISAYLEDCVQAFWNDEELKIIFILESLKESLQQERLDFEEKQKNNFIALVEHREELKSLHQNGKELHQQLRQLARSIEEHSVIPKLEELQHMQKNTETEITKLETEIPELSQKLQKINLEELKRQIISLVKNTLNEGIKL